MKSRRTNAPNVRFSANHVCFTPNGRPWRRVIGTSASDPERSFVLPEKLKHWSLTLPREKLVKIGTKVVRHGRYVTFQMAEAAVPRDLFQDVLRMIDGLRRSPPVPA